MRRRWLTRGWVGLIAGAALVFAACTGGGDAPPSTMPTAAPETPAAESVGAQTTPAPPDGPLTGAPVPLAVTASAAFDADRVIQGANFPPLNDPAVVEASDATWLEEKTIVLGAVQNGEARVYPVFMIAYHHVANDTLGGLPYLVTY